MAPLDNSPRLTAATPPALISDEVETANAQFLKKHPQLTGPVLCGHRVGAAFEALRAFIASNTASAQPDFEIRLCNYAELLKMEMVRCGPFTCLTSAQIVIGFLRELSYSNQSPCAMQLSHDEEVNHSRHEGCW